MTSILFAVGIVLAATVIGLRLLARRASRTPDRAWRPTGVRSTTGRDYLQAQGIANSLEARKHTPSGRRYQCHVAPVASTVGATAQRPTGVVQFRRRQG